MTTNLLILGGTTEAALLCRMIAQAEITATVSLAGRVKAPAPLPLPRRIGGFGGVDGLAEYLTRQRISHVIDATHPFAAQISANAVAACRHVGLPLVALNRPAWQAGDGDRWTKVADMAAGVAALDRPPLRVMLALGRMHLADFAVHPHHFYLLRLVDAPDAPLPFPHHHAVIARGPFTTKGDIALLREHRIDLIVAKNAGGTGAVAKIHAARALGLPIVMIDRPALPDRVEVPDIAGLARWLAAHGIDLGV